MGRNERHDTLKYEYVRRTTYDYFSERMQKHIDFLRQECANLKSYCLTLEDAIHALEAETESIRLDTTSVRIAGRREASERRV